MERGLFNRRFRSGLCTGLILFALLLRAALTPEAAAWAGRLLQSPRLAAAAVFLQTGIRPDPPQAAAPPTDSPAAEAAAPPTDSPAADAAEPTQDTAAPLRETEAAVDFALAFTPAEADRITLRGNCTYEVDKQALLAAPLTWHTDGQGPQVLIVHTHTTEAYTQSPGYEYEESSDYRTRDNSRNVVAVGNALKNALEAEGVSVIHSDSCHDDPHYNEAYYNASLTIEWYLSHYPSIVMVLDVHRDAAETPFAEVTELDGQTAAKIMLLTGTDEGGLSHPNWRENLSFLLKLQALVERDCPGLLRNPSLRKERFNTHETPASLILEVGSNGNTLPEALHAVKYLAPALAAILRAQQE